MGWVVDTITTLITSAIAASTLGTMATPIVIVALLRVRVLNVLRAAARATAITLSTAATMMPAALSVSWAGPTSSNTPVVAIPNRDVTMPSRVIASKYIGNMLSKRPDRLAG